MNTNYKFAIDKIQEAYDKQSQKETLNKYITLYKSIKACILNKDLPHNWLLPSTRVLAREMQFSRTTTNKAYELLQLERLIIPKAGSGNRVNYEPSHFSKKNVKDDFSKTLLQQHVTYPPISKKGEMFLNNMSLINRPKDNNIAFKPGLPPLDIFPINQWKKLLNNYWMYIKSSGLSYHQTTGVTDFKKSICNYLNVSRNIKCEYDQIIVTSGNLQSLFLITSAIIEIGDTVILENPVFPNVHSIFKSQQSNILPISLDKEGISLNEIKYHEDLKPKLVHTTPSNHYPLGIRMTLKRRKDLLKWASKNSALIIENDYENEIANYETRLPAIYNLDTEDRTVYLTTFNRLLHPSLRLGFMIVPKFLVKTIEALQEHSHRFVTPSIQTVMNQFIEKNYLYKHLKTSIEIAKERHDLFKQEFESQIKTMYIQEKPFSSFHVLALFKDEVSLEDEANIILKLKERNISCYPLSKCYIGKPLQKGLIIGYASVRSTIIKKKIKAMQEII